jgi:hypothetical protein
MTQQSIKRWELETLASLVVMAPQFYASLGRNYQPKKPILHSSTEFSQRKPSTDNFTEPYQLYHNYVRPHEALDGKTPAEACGIKIEVDNKWMTLIQNASKKEG